MTEWMTWVLKASSSLSRFDTRILRSLLPVACCLRDWDPVVMETLCSPNPAQRAVRELGRVQPSKTEMHWSKTQAVICHSRMGILTGSLLKEGVSAISGGLQEPTDAFRLQMLPNIPFLKHSYSEVSLTQSEGEESTWEEGSKLYYLGHSFIK